MITTLKLPPGIYRNGTEYQALNRWYDSNLVRWFEGTIRPVGGWRPWQGGLPSEDLTVEGVARGAYSWRTNDGTRYGAIGTNTNLYAFRASSEMFDITPSGFTPGAADETQSVAYGAGIYGSTAYGIPRQEAGDPIPAATWALDNFGQYLVGVSSTDGVLYVWDLDESGLAEAIVATSGTVPVDNLSLIVTSERFLFALGANGNPRSVQWSDQEDYTAWEIAATTQAGSFELQTNSDIRCGLKVRNQTLLLTGQDAHVSNYIGPPFIYGFELIANGCGTISKKSAVAVDNFAVWMSDNGFFIYDGYVKPLACEVADYVFSRLNTSQKSKVYAVHDSSYAEVKFFYPMDDENDSYVVWNYRENHWSIGALDRTAGIDRDVFQNPIMVDSAGSVFEHEVGFEYDDQTPYLESGPLQIGEGENTMMIRELIPDESTQGDVRARFATKWYPNGTEYDYGPYSMANPTSVRFSGRQFKAKLEGVELTDWRVGSFRFDVVPGGRR